MTVKKFIIKTTTKIITFSVIMGIITYLINYPTFTNNIAMLQFENSDYAYAIWSGFLQFKNLFNSLNDVFISIFAGVIIFDIYEFIKHNKGENTHEN